MEPYHVSTWRRVAAPIIRRVLAEHAGESIAAIRRALRDAYPFGPMKYHPYKIWCDEIRVQLGLKKRTMKAGGAHKAVLPPDPRQEGLF